MTNKVDTIPVMTSCLRRTDTHMCIPHGIPPHVAHSCPAGANCTTSSRFTTVR